MTVYRAGFSERVFEFGFNAEYAARHKAVLAAAPDIPTQNSEKWLGYDIAFALKQHGGAVRYLALQHKVARYVDGTNWKNKHFTDAVGGRPYFAIDIDPVQFNLIEEVATSAPPYVDFYYCTPVFHGLNTMNGHYLANSVEANSIWIDVANIGQLDNSECHTIVYAKAATEAFVFSDKGRKAKTIRPVTREVSDRKDLPQVQPRQVYEWLQSAVHQHYNRRTPPTPDATARNAGPARPVPMQAPPHLKTDSEGDVIEALGTLAADYLNSTLLVEVVK